MSGGSIRDKFMSPRGEFKKRSASFRHSRKARSAARKELYEAPSDPPTPWEVIDKFIENNPDMAKGDMLNAILSDQFLAGSQESGDDSLLPSSPLRDAVERPTADVRVKSVKRSWLRRRTDADKHPPPPNLIEEKEKRAKEEKELAAILKNIGKFSEKEDAPKKEDDEKEDAPKEDAPKKDAPEKDASEEESEARPQGRPTASGRRVQAKPGYTTLGRLPAVAMTKMLEIASASHDQLRLELDKVRAEVCVERKIRFEQTERAHLLELDNQRLDMQLERAENFDQEREQLEASIDILEGEKRDLELVRTQNAPLEAERDRLVLEKEELEERLSAVVLADSGLVESERSRFEEEITELRLGKQELQTKLEGSKDTVESLLLEKEQLQEKVEESDREKQNTVVTLEKLKTVHGIVETELSLALLEKEQYAMSAEHLQERLDALHYPEQTIKEITQENDRLYRENQMVMDRLRET